jgi:pyruvate dehydrogenase E2 component (dihydrolipoamide acetyltransferase)
MATRVVMPPLGETMDEGMIVKWLKAEGDAIAKGDQLFEVETDKVVIPVESFGNGILRKIIVPEGETVPIGTLVGIIASPEEDISGIV